MRFVIACAAAGWLAAAAEPTAAQTIDAPPAPAGAALTDFAWLAGDWQSEPFPDVLNETQLMPPRADVMTGMVRLSKDRRLLVQELFVFRETPDGAIEMRLRHFDAELAPREEVPYVLRLAEWDGTSALFTPVTESTLKWTRVTRRADGWTTESEIETRNGERMTITNVFRRAP